MSNFKLPPDKAPNPDFDWEIMTELKLLEKMIFEDEHLKLFQEELKAEKAALRLLDTKIELNKYSLGKREILNEKN